MVGRGVAGFGNWEGRLREQWIGGGLRRADRPWGASRGVVRKVAGLSDWVFRAISLAWRLDWPCGRGNAVSLY